MKKEGLIYLAIFIIGAIVVHPDLLYTPSTRFEWIIERGNYYHPFILSVVVYLLIGIVRLLTIGIKSFWKRFSKN